MKAKVIATGEIVDVTLVDTNGSAVGQYREIFGARHFHLNQLQFINEDPINWEQRRFELVKAALPEAMRRKTEYWTVEDIVNIAVSYADTAIAKLKEK